MRGVQILWGGGRGSVWVGLAGHKGPCMDGLALQGGGGAGGQSREGVCVCQCVWGRRGEALAGCRLPLAAQNLRWPLCHCK